MTKIVRSLPMTIVLSAAAVSMLSGCGALRNFVELFRTADHSMRFVQQVPGPVSVAWRNERGDVWLVPKRDVLIEQIRTDAGPADWGPYGAYVVIRGHHRGTACWSMAVGGICRFPKMPKEFLSARSISLA